MPDLTTRPTISIVVPFHNEEANIIELYGQLQGVMEAARILRTSC